MATKRPKTEKLPTVKPRRKWLRRAIWITLLLGVMGAAAAVTVVLIIAAGVPPPDRPGNYHPYVTTKVMSADGELIGEIYHERRTVIAIEKIPKVMINALVDAEDAEFYEHHGVSYWGIFRALVSDLRPGAHLQGASTLTQQLVRNYFLHDTSRTAKRKIKEIILARRIEDKLSKNEILWLYLNQIELPYQRFGIEEAAQFYFGKSVTEVDAGEAALLAALYKGGTEDPWKYPDKAKDRQKYVLSQMVRYQHLTPADAEKFARAPIKLVRTPAPYLGIAPEFVDQVKHVLQERMGAEQMYKAGLTVVTSCDARIQKLARESLEKGLQALDERHGYRKPLAHLADRALALHLKKLAHDFPNGPRMGNIVEGVIRGKSRAPIDGFEVDLGARAGFLPLPAQADRYNPKALPAEKRFAVGDVVRVRVIDAGQGDRAPILALELGPQAAAVVIDPNTREVKAIVGGYGYRSGSFNHAIAAQPCAPGKAIAGCRQPGSSFKPFLYATAFSTEKWTPASVLIDGPQVYASEGMKPWKPANAEHEEYLGPVRLRVALARSLNTVASQLVDVERGGVDPAAVVQLARDAGIESELAANPSLALGADEVSLFELTNAYASFASGGKRMTPQLVKQVGGDVEPPPSAQATQAMKPELAYLLTSMMTSVIEEGTAASARGKLKRPAAGKTGTTNSHRDAWFIGYTPDLVTGVWVGFDDMRELGRGEQGSRSALPIWVDIMQGALKGVPPKPFTQPPGVVVQKIDPKTGLLAPPGSPGGLDEVFLEGTAPTEVAPSAGEQNPDTYIIDQDQ